MALRDVIWTPEKIEQQSEIKEQEKVTKTREKAILAGHEPSIDGDTFVEGGSFTLAEKAVLRTEHAELVAGARWCAISGRKQADLTVSEKAEYQTAYRGFKTALEGADAAGGVCLHDYMAVGAFSITDRTLTEALDRRHATAKAQLATSKNALALAEYISATALVNANVDLQVAQNHMTLAEALLNALPRVRAGTAARIAAEAAEAARIKALAQREAEAKANLAAASAREAIVEGLARRIHEGCLLGVAFLLAIVISGALGLLMPALKLGVELFKVLFAYPEGEWHGIGALPLLFIVAWTFLSLGASPGGAGFLKVMWFGIAMGVAYLFIFVT